MPYGLEQADGGYYVVGPGGRKSKKPMSLGAANRQMSALYVLAPPGPRRQVHMPMGEYKMEHKRLVRTLEEGSKVKRMAEAARQRSEMMARLG